MNGDPVMRCLPRPALAALLLLACLAGCSSGTPGAPPPAVSAPATPAAVQGTIMLPAGAVLAADMHISVRLEDVSRIDAATVTVAEILLPATAGQQQVPFSIAYRPEDIQARNTYSMKVRVNDASGKLRYISTQSYNVITRGNPTRAIDIAVKPVGNR